MNTFVKKIKQIIEEKRKQVQKTWAQLTRKKQRRILLGIFLGYVLIAVLMMIKTWTDIGTQSYNSITLTHIRSIIPYHPKDSATSVDSALLKLKKSFNHEQK
jgi:hypothetical protein